MQTTDTMRTIAARRQADERIVVATVSNDQRTILTAAEREYFDAPEHRETRRMMSANRAPFLS
jgi:hypothetical protein